MRRTLAFLLMSSGVEALASEGGGWMARLWYLPTIFWQILNFALVVAFFVFLLRKSAPEYFSKRARAIRDALEKAIREREAALERLREVEAKMSRLGEEVASIEKDAQASAEAEKARILVEAEETRERIRAEAVAEVDRKVQAARRELRAYAAQLVEEMAKKRLKDEATAEDEARLLEGFFQKLEAEDHDRLG